jgi:NAD+ kinase
LKWNERERQKSFVVVEEGPAKSKKRHRHRSTTEDKTNRHVKVSAPELGLAEVTLEDEEVDEVSEEDEEDEEDKFDIDDSSPESALEKTPVDHKHKMVTEAKSPPTRRNKSRSQTRSKLHHSGDARKGVASPHLQPPRTATRQFDFGFHMSPRGSDHSVDPAPPENLSQHGSRDDIHVPRSSLLGGKSRIPKDRDLDVDIIKTPTTSELRRGRRAHPHTVSSSSSADFQPRAFAVWGQDESDSNASESESEFQG